MTDIDVYKRQVTWLSDGWFVINDRKGPSLTQKAPELPECTFEKWTRDDFDDEMCIRDRFIWTPREVLW